MKNYFSLKCKTPAVVASNVVYKFTCLHDAGVTYIGETERFFGVRSAEHFDPNHNSSVASHIRECTACQDGDLKNSIIIVKRSKSAYDNLINEALKIQKDKPSLNVQMFDKGASYKLKVFT